MVQPVTRQTSRKTPLYELHRSLDAKMTDFAGWCLPLSYPQGLMREHLHTRSAASLFDVSHMGQIEVTCACESETESRLKNLEQIVPAGLTTLKPTRARYGVMTNAQGGIIDDLIVTRDPHGLFIVVNAARFDVDFLHLRETLGQSTPVYREDLALLALQGPQAEAVLSDLLPQAATLGFMQSVILPFSGAMLRLSRLGYTGEDGFELSMPADQAPGIAQRLLADPRVEPAGLGARDTLRLEAALRLYGADMDENTSPVEAGLAWTIPRRRREARDFQGAERICRECEDGPPRTFVGLRTQGRAIARAGAQICDPDGEAIGSVTSGGFSPSLDCPIAMGYIKKGYSFEGEATVALRIRGKCHGAVSTSLPFVPHQFRREP